MFLKITSTGTGSRRVVRLEGELDVTTANSLSTELAGLITSTTPPRIVLDLSALAFCDSTGLGVLITAAHECHIAGGWLRLDNVHPAVERLLTITGMTELTGRD
ncbi:STAS domain-containing protein [Phytomonospora sp. NPDC050363]|uniref:STAS domain-containing protein n=1 Tax=Phytomonospora sp. NPDC050363 TaxID=3155642 RepID=UPI0033C7F915